MNKKSISILVASTIAAATIVSGANADMFNFRNDDNRFEMREVSHFKKGVDGHMKGLTDEERTALETMTFEEREEKMEERKAIIEKKINGEELTEEEKEILEELENYRRGNIRGYRYR